MSKIQNYLDRLSDIDKLISKSKTGNPANLAEKFNVSDRTIYNLLNVLKSLGAPVVWNEEKQSYCYRKQGSLIIKWVKRKGV